ncbi:MAG: redoxin domain-containing protein [Acidobacteria bacterium]|nr:redoxin domain-containing protein [Acidobacteriota bacterium]
MLSLRQIIPPLTARAHDGRIIHAWDYKQKKSLAIVFLHSDCPPCEEYLRGFVKHAGALKENDSAALAIFPAAVPADLVLNLPPEVVLAADISGRAQGAFLGDGDGKEAVPQLGVFVTDRYGELEAQWVVQDERQLPSVQEVISWLAHTQIRC